jgi:hypothetical protein
MDDRWEDRTDKGINQPSSIKFSRERSVVPATGSATASQIRKHLAVLSLCYPQQEMSEAQANLKFQIFCDDLAQFPERVIAAACLAYRRDPKNTFFPTPGQLYALCKEERGSVPRTFHTASAEEREAGERTKRELDEWFARKRGDSPAPGRG